MTTVTGTSRPVTDPPPRLRASDAEREQAVARLHEALGEGRLDLAETEERVAGAYAAQYRDELAPLLADLTDPGSTLARPGSEVPTWQALWVLTVWWARATLLGAAGGDRPTPAQLRAAAVLVTLAVLWTVAWAFLGAGLVR